MLIDNIAAATVSIPFAQGQVEGYLETRETQRFWERYNLLIALNLHGSLAYAHEESMDWWPGRLSRIIDDHQFEDNGPPRWFEGPG